MVLSREKILDTAYEVLATYGLADLSMRRLAQELHVAPGALYYHVKNKQQLLILLADYILARAPKSMSEEAEPTVEAVRASMIQRGDTLFSLLYPIRECPEVVRLSLALHPRELKPVVAMAHEFQSLGMGHAEALRRARLLTHTALSLVDAAAHFSAGGGGERRCSAHRKCFQPLPPGSAVGHRHDDGCSTPVHSGGLTSVLAPLSLLFAGPAPLRRGAFASPSARALTAQNRP